MKKLFTFLIAVFLLAYTAGAGNYIALISTNTTPTQLVFTNTVIPSVVLALTTNSYNLQVNAASQGNLGGQQASTNSYLSTSFSPQGNYPGTIYGPYRETCFEFCFTNSAANTSSAVFSFAGSLDGNYWASNIMVLSVAAGTTTLTNYDSTAYPYIALQSISNTNAASYFSNIVVRVSGKPGL